MKLGHSIKCGKTNLLIAFVAVMSLAMFTGCSKKHKSSRGSVPTYTSVGGGGGNLGEYVAGTDKWHVNFDDQALTQACSKLGLPKDEVVSATIGYVQKFYSGIQISFSTQALPDGSLPSPGQSSSASTLGPGAYNMIAVDGSSSGGATGMAILDSSGSNSRCENDSGGSLGVFILSLASIHPGGNVDLFARNLGTTITHEIGHSLGLNHNSQSGYIMSPAVNISAGEVAFHPDDLNFLQDVLPGPNRSQ
ncbi:MAG: matrixin family metalloprotease [Planctomycetota bacterium]|jgi:hypothetical protein